MPTEITAPRINSNMAPSQPIAGVKIKAADGEEADTDRNENQVQHLRSPKGPAHSRREFGAVL
jgi:hypothetical protein